MVPDAPLPGLDQWPWSTAPAPGPVGRLGRPTASNPWAVDSLLPLGRPTCVRCPGPLGSCSPLCPRGLLCCVCAVLGHLAPVNRGSRSVCCVVCAVSWAPWLPFTGVPAGCVVLRLRCPGPLGSCSLVRPLGVLLWMCCPWPLGSCSPVCLLRLLFCLCGVLGHLAPVHWCARSLCCFVGAVSWATWLPFTGVPGRGVPSLCSPRCICMCGVQAHVAPVHRCARCVRCPCAVGGCVPLPPPLIFFSVFFRASSFFFLKCKKVGARTLQAQAWATGAAVQ